MQVKCDPRGDQIKRNESSAAKRHFSLFASFGRAPRIFCVTSRKHFPDSAPWIILHLFVFLCVFCFPVASTNLGYDLFSSEFSKNKTKIERKSALPLSSIVCCEKQCTLGKQCCHYDRDAPVDCFSAPYVAHMCCLFVFCLVFLCTPSEKSLIKRNLSRSLINLQGHEGSGPQRCQSDAF